MRGGGGKTLAAPPNVSGVTLVQPQGTRKAQVTYTTDGAGIATFQFRTNGVDISHAEAVRTVTGDISRYLPAAGTYTFAWDALRDFPERVVSNLTVEVTLWATNAPPTYCAVSLVPQNGQYPVLFYGKESEVPFGVTDSWWKRHWLLMRQIPSTAGQFVTLGSPPGEGGRDNTREAQRSVRITKPFYMGVFEVTHTQWQVVYGVRAGSFTNPECFEDRPANSLPNHSVRGAWTNGAAYDWPASGHAVAPASFMGLLRDRTGGVLEFDLPTEAQWEYACRAGTTGAWNNGTTSMGNNNNDPNGDLLGRHQYNGGYINNGGTMVAPTQATCTDENGTARVGAYLPNAWGLYDMHGNLWELTLDWFVADATDPSMAGDDPAGPATGASRVNRGGGWSYNGVSMRSARRGTYNPGGGDAGHGFRVVAPAELIIQ